MAPLYAEALGALRITLGALVADVATSAGRSAERAEAVTDVLLVAVEGAFHVGATAPAVLPSGGVKRRSCAGRSRNSRSPESP